MCQERLFIVRIPRPYLHLAPSVLERQQTQFIVYDNVFGNFLFKFSDILLFIYVFLIGIVKINVLEKGW